LEASRRNKRSESPKGDVAAHLHLERTSFVGRDADITHIVKLLEKSRLVTLTGFGGIGKTRAALEVVKQLAGTAWDEICFVELSPLTDGAYIATKVASTIQPALTDRIETISALASALAKRRMLLILDNCEHVVTGAAHATDTILEACPHVTILATSREPLNIAGEVVYRLVSLSLPQKTPVRLEEAHAYSAVDLFIQRAEAADPRAAFGTESLGTIVNIARRLDGIPLAIELATAQSPILGLQTLQGRLDEHFNIPAGRRDLPPRLQKVKRARARGMPLHRATHDLLLSSLQQQLSAGGHCSCRRPGRTAQRRRGGRRSTCRSGLGYGTRRDDFAGSRLTRLVQCGNRSWRRA